jgi:hypothetical protein
MPRKCFSSLLAIAVLMAGFLTPIRARAAVTEIRKDFLDLTSLLPASPVMAAPSVAGSYMICVTVGNVETTAPTAVLRWTDENGLPRSFTYPAVNGVPNGCDLIRNAAGTAATIETDGSYDGSYNLVVFGIGFWPNGTQAQAGLSEAVNYAVSGANGGFEFSFPGFPWLFAVIANSNCQWQLTGGSAGTLSEAGARISTSYGTGSGEFSTLTTACNYTLIALQFGGPQVGSGPLTDYEYDLLDWTDATYPQLMTVFTASGDGANILLASNIAEKPNSKTKSEELIASWSGQISVPCAASVVGEPSGEPGSCVSSAVIEPNTALQIQTRNAPGQGWGSSPAYSAEVDVIEF